MAKVRIFFLYIYELPRLKNSVAISYEYFIDANNFLINVGISMNPNPAKLAGFDLEDKATNEILPNWQDLK